VLQYLDDGDSHDDSESEVTTTAVLYIGEKQEQITSILMRIGQCSLISYSPFSGQVSNTGNRGSDSREFRERYGGVSRVKDAKIIGIIIGSMGLSGEITLQLLTRLKALITAARKRYYCLVMGRLNEAKLCNFPQVDVFCLISNDDLGVIKPKTFHVPVVTPWELELGLGAREWSSCYKQHAAAILEDEIDLDLAVRRVASMVPESAIDDDESDEYRVPESSSSPTSSSSTALTTFSIENRLVLSSSDPAVEHFQSRSFQGLEPNIPDDQDTKIHKGLFGIAQSYSK